MHVKRGGGLPGRPLCGGGLFPVTSRVLSTPVLGCGRRHIPVLVGCAKYTLSCASSSGLRGRLCTPLKGGGGGEGRRISIQQYACSLSPLYFAHMQPAYVCLRRFPPMVLSCLPTPLLNFFSLSHLGLLLLLPLDLQWQPRTAITSLHTTLPTGHH